MHHFIISVPKYFYTSVYFFIGNEILAQLILTHKSYLHSCTSLKFSLVTHMALSQRGMFICCSFIQLISRHKSVTSSNYGFEVYVTTPPSFFWDAQALSTLSWTTFLSSCQPIITHRQHSKARPPPPYLTLPLLLYLSLCNINLLSILHTFSIIYKHQNITAYIFGR